MSWKFKQTLFAFCVLFLTLGTSAHAALVPIPDLKTRVTDLTQTLNPEQQVQLEAKLAAFEQDTGSQIAVLLVPSTQPEAIEQYSIRVVDSWKLGREKQDDGVLLLVAKDDRKMRIEVGYGLEGAIPDVITKRIIAEIMTPHFRQGDFYGGITQAVEQLMRLIKGEQLPPPQRTKSAGKTELLDMLPALLIAALVLGSLMRAIFGKFLGGLVNGGVVGALIWMLGGGLVLILLLALIVFFLTFAGATNLAYMGGMGGGYGRSGGFGGGFGGMGGGFGGGGASGSW